MIQGEVTHGLKSKYIPGYHTSAGLLDRMGLNFIVGAGAFGLAEGVSLAISGGTSSFRNLSQHSGFQAYAPEALRKTVNLISTRSYYNLSTSLSKEAWIQAVEAPVINRLNDTLIGNTPGKTVWMGEGFIPTFAWGIKNVYFNANVLPNLIARRSQ